MRKNYKIQQIKDDVKEEQYQIERVEISEKNSS